MNRSKRLILFFSFVFLIIILIGWGIKSSYFSQLKQHYITWKKIRFLDNEFHILKSKEEIIKLENLTTDSRTAEEKANEALNQFKKTARYNKYNQSLNKKDLIHFFLSKEMWLGPLKSNNTRKEFRFKNNILSDVYVYFIEKENIEKIRVYNKLLLLFGKKSPEVWSFSYKEKKIKLVFKKSDPFEGDPIEDHNPEYYWEGFELWVSIN